MPRLIPNAARLITQALLPDLGFMAKAVLAQMGLLVVAAGLLLAAGIVALTRVVGFPLAAVIFAVILGLAAALIHRVGRIRARRHAQQSAIAQARLQADLALAATAARSLVPFLPIVAIVAAVTFLRRK